MAKATTSVLIVEALVRRLIERGGIEIAVVGRRRYPDLEEAGVTLHQPGLSLDQVVLRVGRGAGAVYGHPGE